MSNSKEQLEKHRAYNLEQMKKAEKEVERWKLEVVKYRHEVLKINAELLERS